MKKEKYPSEEVRAIYDYLLHSGELQEVMRSAKLDWDKDKKKFISIYSNLANSLPQRNTISKIKE